MKKYQTLPRYDHRGNRIKEPLMIPRLLLIPIGLGLMVIAKVLL